MSAESEPEEHLQPQAGSPAQNNRIGEGEQIDYPESEQFLGEQAIVARGVSDLPLPPGHSGEQESEHNKRDIKIKDEQVPVLEGEQNVGEQAEDWTPASQSNRQYSSDPSSQWLKNVLPEASNGWWDVRVKGERLTAKFRWRDPALQVITLFHITRENIETMMQKNNESPQRMIREQIRANLHNFLHDPAKYDKAIVVAEKLGIEIENHQVRQIEN